MKSSVQSKNNWYVITGGPSSGKTTLITELEKKGYRVVHESARAYIDEQLAKGRSLEEVRGDQKTFQENVLDFKLQQEAELPKDELVFLDRGIPDTEAYCDYLHLPQTPELHEAIENCFYKKVFLLDPLPLERDYARTETEEEQYQIHRCLHKAYSSLAFPLIVVPVLAVSARVDFILKNL